MNFRLLIILFLFTILLEQICSLFFTPEKFKPSQARILSDDADINNDPIAMCEEDRDTYRDRTKDMHILHNEINLAKSIAYQGISRAIEKLGISLGILHKAQVLKEANNMNESEIQKLNNGKKAII